MFSPTALLTFNEKINDYIFFLLCKMRATQVQLGIPNEIFFCYEIREGSNSNILSVNRMLSISLAHISQEALLSGLLLCINETQRTVITETYCDLICVAPLNILNNLRRREELKEFMTVCSSV